MKILLYTENQKLIGKSGLGKAIKNQIKTLSLMNIPYTTDLKENYDILHINTYFPISYELACKSKKEGKKINVINLRNFLDRNLFSVFFLL